MRCLLFFAKIYIYINRKQKKKRESDQLLRAPGSVGTRTIAQQFDASRREEGKNIHTCRTLLAIQNEGTYIHRSGEGGFKHEECPLGGPGGSELLQHWAGARE